MSRLTKMMFMRDGSRNDGGGQMRGNGGNYGGYNRDRSGYNEFNIDEINYRGDMNYNSYRGGEIENRRRRDSRGRFMESNGGNMEMRQSPRRQYGGEMNRIGFDMRGDEDAEMYWPPYCQAENHYGGEEERGEMKRGHGGGKMMFMPMDKHRAEKWVRSMKNADGSTGEKWSMEQAKQLMQQADIDAEPAEFYAVLNAVYSDYGKVAKKHKCDTIEFYVDMAKAWINDKDAVRDKASAYYDCVVKHDEE